MSFGFFYKHPDLNVAIAVLTGLISGSCSARLIAVVNMAIASNSPITWWYSTLSANRLLVTLTEDVQAISNSVFAIPSAITKTEAKK